MIDANKLLACPYCNGHCLENFDDTQGQIHCRDCGARGPLPRRLQQAVGFDIRDNIDAWLVRQGEKTL